MENKEESFFPNFDPTNDLSQAGKQRRMKRGLGAKPLLESEIKDFVYFFLLLEYNIKRGKYSLDDLIAGKYPDYPVWKLKSRLLLNGYMLEKCSCCGFEEKRLTDGKVPLVLDFIDGNRKNHKYDNLRMLCFNCSFLLNGNLTGPKKEYEY